MFIKLHNTLFKITLFKIKKNAFSLNKYMVRNDAFVYFF